MMTFRQAHWDELLIIERSSEGRVGFSLPSLEAPANVPSGLLRKSPPRLPELSETEVIRHYLRLSQENYGVDSGIYPLGSCTMKYNPKLLDRIVATHKIQDLHPLQDSGSVQGILRILYELSEWLAEIVGLSKVSPQPAAGAHGEFAGAMIMRAYHRENGDLEKRDELIVPDSAHGTNPASAAMAGFRVVEIPSNSKGCVDVGALRSSVSPRTAGLMLTNPNTLGIFEADILEIAKVVHDAGGLLYYDGANLNAMLGKAKPGRMGFDIVHINIHKTFATPHGGGGPGSGPIVVTKELERFLPVPTVEREGDRYYLDFDRPSSVGKVRSFWGNVAVLLRAYAYILMMGRDGLEEVADISVLNANYLAKKLSQIRGLELPFPDKLRKHEFVLSAAKMTRETGVTAAHLSKRLLDFGIHAPTVYFPLIVEEAMMIEPTETVSKQELDETATAFSKASDEAYSNPDLLKDAPRNTAVTRVDEARASHPRTMQLTWRRATETPQRTQHFSESSKATPTSAGSSMKVKVKFFALVRELTGKREEEVDLDDKATVRTLLDKLVDEYGPKFRDYLFDPASKEPRGHLQFLIDGRNIALMQGLNTILRDGNSFAILPPVGGGLEEKLGKMT